MPVIQTGATTDRPVAEHRTKLQLLEAADTHFRHYGYKKTTVADLARAIGVSPAYVYRFFESKPAIGEAVCGAPLGRILADDILDVRVSDKTRFQLFRRGPA